MPMDGSGIGGGRAPFEMETGDAVSAEARAAKIT